MNPTPGILSLEALAAWRAEMRRTGKTVVVTNGCFDIIHPGHVSYLSRAREMGDILLVGLNSDASVRALKGESRPINTAEDRATVLASLRCVDAVAIFQEPTATAFLKIAAPDVYVKGGDYTPETLNKEERQAVESHGGKIAIIPFIPGKSTTRILQKISKL